MMPALMPSGNTSVPNSVPTLSVINPATVNAFINVWSASSNANDNIPGKGNGSRYGPLRV